MKNIVIMPIHGRWLELLLSGKKVVELRKRSVWSSVDTILFYENGTGLINAKARLLRQSVESVLYIQRLMSEQTCVSDEELESYASMQVELNCLFVSDVVRLKTPLSLAEVGLSHAPQAYVYRDMEVPV